jgi:hypothetical protein
MISPTRCFGGTGPAKEGALSGSRSLAECFLTSDFETVIRLIANTSEDDTLEQTVDCLIDRKLLRPARPDGSRYTT